MKVEPAVIGFKISLLKGTEKTSLGNSYQKLNIIFLCFKFRETVEDR